MFIIEKETWPGCVERNRTRPACSCYEEALSEPGRVENDDDDDGQTGIERRNVRLFC